MARKKTSSRTLRWFGRREDKTTYRASTDVLFPRLIANEIDRLPNFVFKKITF